MYVSSFFMFVCPFVCFYGDFDVSENLFADFADRNSECCDSIGGIEVENAPEILIIKVFCGIPATPGQDGVDSADRRGIQKLRPDGVIIILFQKRIVNDVEDVAVMVIPIFLGKIPRGLKEHLLKRCVGNIIIPHEHIGNRSFVFRLQRPEVQIPRTCPCSGVRYVENVAQTRRIAAGVQEGNPDGTAPDIPSHAVVPDIIFRTGGRVGTLGVDHELFVIRVFVQSGRGGEEGSPVFHAVGELFSGSFGKVGIKL
ncbi:MAG: hypothetical protein IJP32_02955 [Clostridia bacterium]|nr:hypothetical protein [Clostridia bacterium]